MNEDIVMRLKQTLAKILPKKVKIAQPTLYTGGWEQFITRFCAVGGVIECAPPLCALNQLNFPSVCFMIEPDGNVRLVGSYDKFSSSEFVNAGCFFPQTSLPAIDLTKICQSVGEALYERSVIGHVTIDLLSFPNTEDPTSHPYFWAIDINCELTDFAAVTYFFDILMEGHLNQQTGEYAISYKKDAEDEYLEDSDAMDELGNDDNPNRSS